MKKSGSQQLLAKQRLPRASVRLHGLGECLLLLGSGFLTAGAQIGGLALPLGACLTASLPFGKRSLSAALGAAAGYALLCEPAMAAERIALTALLLAAIVGLFAAAYVALRKRIRDRQNAVLMRGKRANKVAVQRFRAAAKFMQEENRHAFYEEMLRALWGYMSDKFNIPVANLTKENVREELNKRGVSQELSQSFSEIISQCDEAQYSPLAGARMSDVYNAGVDFISKLESVIKK